MSSYWRSLAAEILPSWLKNLRSGRPRAAHVPDRQGPGTGPVNDSAVTGLDARPIANGAPTDVAPPPGTSAPAQR